MNREIWNHSCIISPSLICLDLCNLEQQVRIVEESGIQMLHVDILDGHFSPSMPLGLETVKQLRKRTDLEFEAHVMAADPRYFIDELLDCGVSQIVFHIETADHVDGLLKYIIGKGARAGVALKPGTPLSVLEYVLEQCDAVLLMLINPGFAQCAGEAQVSYGDRKIRDLRKMINSRELDTKIILDGRISPENIKDYGNGIANIFVAGSTCIKKDELAGSLRRMNELALSLNAGSKEGLHGILQR